MDSKSRRQFAQNILHEIESLRQQLAECERERDELVEALEIASHGLNPKHLDYKPVFEALAKVERREAEQLGAGKTGD